MTAPAQLLSPAAAQPLATAMSCAQRVTTYRKLCSRIERAAARLQNEWDVGPGDVVVYAGGGHQDAVVLFFALRHCGAHLLLVADAGGIAALSDRRPVRRVLNDDGAPLAGHEADPLHAIIASPCPHPVRPAAGGSLLIRDGGAVPMDALCAAARPRAGAVRVDAAALFDKAVFAPQVLSALFGGGSVAFD
ncbi:MAG: hypothetical protein ACTHKB_09595 [Burkholderiaceae bacterium]